MIKKILIANRGEIAVRIIRTCKDLGIKTVAIFSDIDRISPHVLKADEAFNIGPANSIESYLNIEKILKVAQESSCDAIHPGYGFLSENSLFANKIISHDLTWIGPSPKVIDTMGNKIASRILAEKAGVPVVPGTSKPVEGLEDATKIAEKIGYPVLVKASEGGGGKGMRIVQSFSELEKSIERSKSEANKSFGNSEIFIEKYLEEPHHIEIQILADNYGNIVSLGERECSIQRRYQKIIEETPSSFVNAVLRKKLSESAINISKLCNYSGVGTVEFLVDKYKNYYFLEMNTRLQVEHPITEIVTGIDLVKEQILVASKKKLTFKQNNIKNKGHAIECRIYAEDGFNSFAPSTGKIDEIIIPLGPGVRLDEGIQAGQKITPYYDPLLGKLISWGENRNIAINRMYRSLKEFRITGIKSTIPFCTEVIKDQNFKKGGYNTHTLETILNRLGLNKLTNKRRKLVARIGAARTHSDFQQEVNSLENQSIDNRWILSGLRDAID